jgi:hypothetical protein
MTRKSVDSEAREKSSEDAMRRQPLTAVCSETDNGAEHRDSTNLIPERLLVTET